MEKFYCTKSCWGGKFCSRPFCPYYHSEAERRCAKHVEGECKDAGEHPYWKICDDGLHVWPCDVNLTLSVDLECAEDVRALKDHLTWTPLNEAAKVVRLVVYGFTDIRTKPLELICPLLPLLHELVLPDRTKEYDLFVLLYDLVQTLALSNPKL